MNEKTAIGVGLSFVLTSQLYPLLLSSPFTVRTLGKERNETKNIIVDSILAFIVSVIATLYLSYLLQDKITAISGIIFALAMLILYLYRGGIIG